MKSYPLMIGLLGAWSYGMMAPSLSDTNMGKKYVAKEKTQYQSQANNVQKYAPGKKQAPKYKLVERTKKSQ